MFHSGSQVFNEKWLSFLFFYLSKYSTPSAGAPKVKSITDLAPQRCCANAVG